MKPNSEHAPLPADAGEESIASLDKIRNSKGNLHTAEIRRRMQRTMQVGGTSLQLPFSLLALLLCRRGPWRPCAYWLIQSHSSALTRVSSKPASAVACQSSSAPAEWCDNVLRP